MKQRQIKLNIFLHAAIYGKIVCLCEKKGTFKTKWGLNIARFVAEVLHVTFGLYNMSLADQEKWIEAGKEVEERVAQEASSQVKFIPRLKATEETSSTYSRKGKK